MNVNRKYGPEGGGGGDSCGGGDNSCHGGDSCVDDGDSGDLFQRTVS